MTITRVTEDVRELGAAEVGDDVLDIAGQAVGDLMQFDGAVWGPLPPGAVGEVLTIVGGVPAYAAPVSGDFIEYKTFTDVAFINFVTGFSIDTPIMDFYWQLRPTVDGSDTMLCRFSEDGGATFFDQTPNYRRMTNGFKDDSLTAASGSSGDNSIRLTNIDNAGGDTGEGARGHIRLYHPMDASQRCKIFMRTNFNNTAGRLLHNSGGGVLVDETALVNALQIVGSNNGDFSGNVLVRGLRNSA